jgi:NADPH:quinone reductase-like Zn-dependent oxidoreductase
MTVVESVRRAEMELGGPGSLKGKTVLVPAGLSGVGSLALQVLKRIYGAGKVITTVSPAKLPLITDFLGQGVVDQVVDYTRGPAHVIQEIGRGTVDVMLDTAFMEMPYLPVLKGEMKGFLLTITGKEGRTLREDWPEIGGRLVCAVDLLDGWYRWRAGRWGVRYENVFVKADGVDLDVLAGWVIEGKVRPVTGRVVKWEDLVSQYNPLRGCIVAGLPLTCIKGGASGYKSTSRSRIYDSITKINTIDLPSCLYAPPVNLDI